MADQLAFPNAPQDDAEGRKPRSRPANSPEKERALPAKPKQNYWGAEHNARRRAKYASDPTLAEKIREQRRESYRRQRAGDTPVVDTGSCLANIARVDTMGVELPVRAGEQGNLVTGRVFNQKMTATMLDRQPQVIYRWHQRGIFPGPVLQDASGNLYYADVEVKHFVRILGEHQLTTPHYRVDHTDVRAKLMAGSFEQNKQALEAWLEKRRQT